LIPQSGFGLRKPAPAEYTGKIYPDAGNGLALPGYGVLSVGANVNFTPKLNLNLDVYNVTNQRHEPASLNSPPPTPRSILSTPWVCLSFRRQPLREISARVVGPDPRTAPRRAMVG
jgi:outer membrane receptor protein involved in Fe transport